MKKILITSIIVGLISTSIASAQTSETQNFEVKNIPTTTNIPPTKQMELRKTQEEIKLIRETAKKEADVARETFKTEKEQILRALPVNPQEAIKILEDRRNIFQKEAEARKETLKETIDAKREATKDIIAAEEKDLKTKLNQFKNDKNKQVAEKVNNSLNQVNKRAVDRFTKNINEFDRLLVNITTRAEKASVMGNNVDGVMTEIKNARLAISVARESISVQAEKVYSVNITTEKNFSNDLRVARNLLNADLKVVEEKIKASRVAVQNALAELNKIPRINKPVVSTTTQKGSQALPVVTQ